MGNAGDKGSFFQSQSINSNTTALISTQVDPSQPQVDGLISVTDPVIPDRLVVDRLTHFDPSLYDLRDSSHLMKLMKAILGPSGLGGLRKQSTINRLATTVSGTNFLDLDGFWGALFRLSRDSNETLTSLNPDTGTTTPIDPLLDVANADTWDRIASRDARYRSRITRFAKAVSQGATYYGLISAAEAILGVEVDLIESWILADQVPPGQSPASLGGNTWLQVDSKYTNYGAMSGQTWGVLIGGTQVPGQTPLGNRGEVVIRPKRIITLEERQQTEQVLKVLAPAGTLVTVEMGDVVQSPVSVRTLWADSEQWCIDSRITPSVGLIGDITSLYPTSTSVATARPALSRYTGEKWSYNSRISAVTAYTMVNDIQNLGSDFQIVQYLDGQQGVYAPPEAVVNGTKATLMRTTAEGVSTTFPYSPARRARS